MRRPETVDAVSACGELGEALSTPICRSEGAVSSAYGEAVGWQGLNKERRKAEGIVDGGTTERILFGEAVRRLVRETAVFIIPASRVARAGVSRCW